MISNHNARFKFGCLLLFAISLSTPALSQEKASYYTVEHKQLEVRENPDLASKVIAVLQYCDKVLFLENTNIQVTTHCSYGPCTGPMAKIRTADNLVGYVFRYFLSDYREVKYVANQSSYNIEGSWSKYIDEPNVTYYFYKNGKFEEVHTDYETPSTRLGGQYTYDGCCKIDIVCDDGKRMNIEVINVNGEITLKDRCFIFDPAYHGKKRAKKR